MVGRGEDWATSRLEAFSDGVLAIAITLLVLSLQPPVAARGQLWRDLGRQWPFLAAYAVSFFTIGTMWFNHHALFERIARTDRGLMYRNLMLLGGIAFLPYPTGVLATYIRDGGSNARAAAALYGLTMIVISVSFTSLWVHLRHHRALLGGSMDELALRAALVRSASGTAVYVAATLVAAVAPVVSLALFAGVAFFFALSRHAA